MPKLPKSDLATEQEKIRIELSRANELLTQVKTEVRVFQDRRDEIRQGIEAESRQLKLKREQELDAMHEQSENALLPLRQAKIDLQQEVSVLSRAKQKQETELVGIETEVTATRQLLGMITKEANEAQASKDKAELQRVNITAQITSLNSQIQPLREKLADLTDDITGAEARKEEAAWELAALQADLNSKKVVLNREIDGLEHKRRDLASSLNIEAKNMANSREALANWETNLEKRDKILRAREYKVSQDEQRLADNVGLLNL